MAACSRRFTSNVYYTLCKEVTRGASPYLDARAVPPFLRITGVYLQAVAHFVTFDSQGPIRSILTVSNDLLRKALHCVVQNQSTSPDQPFKHCSN